ncbi:MAG: CHC2 zinc finger domain-containing protein [bacterium]|nr:CHC2 zinc finger domain-containing protein [bacterium]
MSILSNRPGADGYCFLSGKDSNIENSVGWEAKIDSPNIEYQLIQLANSRISLHSILIQYNLIFEQSYSSNGWTHKCSCPFTDHRDSKPSFGYNSLEDRFNCFGCHRGGRAVEFIAFIENKSKISAARGLISNISLEEICNSNVISFDYKRLDCLLFSYADSIREFKRSQGFSPRAVEYSNAITWNLDVYLRKHAADNSIILDDLDARITKLREQLKLYTDYE